MAFQSPCEEDYVGDTEILRLLEEARRGFQGGDKSQVMVCVFRCARFQAVIPEWATDALLALQQKMEAGSIADFNAAFAKPKEPVNTRAARARIKAAESIVLAEILQLRTKGVSFSDYEMFSQVVENLRERGVNINHRDVQQIYKSSGQFLKKIPRGPDPKGGHGFALITLPNPRRRGRDILRDQEAG